MLQLLSDCHVQTRALTGQHGCAVGRFVCMSAPVRRARPMPAWIWRDVRKKKIYIYIYKKNNNNNKYKYIYIGILCTLWAYLNHTLLHTVPGSPCLTGTPPIAGIGAVCTCAQPIRLGRGQGQDECLQIHGCSFLDSGCRRSRDQRQEGGGLMRPTLT